jgi:hypothetical protein
MKKFLIAGLFPLALTASSHAFWFGHPGKTPEGTGSSLKLGYAWGERDLKFDQNSSPITNLETHIGYVQYNVDISQDLEFMARGIPQTGRMSLEGTSLNPNLWGLGFGLHWSAPEPMGPLHFGALAAGDWVYGSQDVSGFRDKATFIIGTAALGVGVLATERTSVYGGFSVIKWDADIDVSGIETDFKEEDLAGVYLGTEFLPNESWSLGAELHLRNERTLNAQLGFHF